MRACVPDPTIGVRGITWEAAAENLGRGGVSRKQCQPSLRPAPANARQSRPGRDRGHRSGCGAEDLPGASQAPWCPLQEARPSVVPRALAQAPAECGRNKVHARGNRVRSAAHARTAGRQAPAGGTRVPGATSTWVRPRAAVHDCRHGTLPSLVSARAAVLPRVQRRALQRRQRQPGRRPAPAPSPGSRRNLQRLAHARAGGPQPRGARARATPAGPAELAHPRSEQAKESGGPSAKRPGAPRIPCQSSPVEQCLPARRCPRLAVGPVKRTVKPARAYTA